MNLEFQVHFHLIRRYIMDILGSIYEAKIIEQQITYYILKENYSASSNKNHET